MPKEIRDIATNLMKKPEEIKVKAKEMTVENIDQYFIEIPDRDKFDTLTNHLDINDPELAIVFSRTKKRVDEITEDRKSTRLNSSHVAISYAVFCLKKKRARQGDC